MYDIFEFVMEYVVMPFFCLVMICFIGFCIISLFYIPSCIKHEKEQQKQIEECYMQKPRTDDCEFLLWKYELSKKQPRHTTTAVPVIMPMVR